MNTKNTRNLKQLPQNGIKYMMRRYSYGGLVCGTLLYCFSLLPSLLPRPWLFQAIITSLSIAIGYGLGTVLQNMFLWATEWKASEGVVRRLWVGLLLGAPILIFMYAYLGAIWQTGVKDLLGVVGDGRGHYVLMIVVSLVLAIGLVGLGRSVVRLVTYISNRADRFLPRRVAGMLAIFFVVIGLYWVVTGLLFGFLVSTANSIYSNKNALTPSGVSQPTSSLRSGAPDSLIAWDDLGYQGKGFVARGPSTSQISSFSGEQAVEPIRIYAGVTSASTPAERAELAVEELKRTGAFDREIIILANVTGTGWLEPQAVDSIEYMYNGDTAIVAQQYSYLPSWISFLVDQSNATDAGQALFDAVHAAWYELPEDARPKLVTYGLSLGSFAAQSPYSGVNDLRRSVDGALFVGTPNESRLWRNITDARDGGTPEWQPTYKGGQTVRFVSEPADLASDMLSAWQFPRVLYMQHASDPVVWFNFDLVAKEPDWLKEPAGPDVSDKMRWYPIVTFLQVTIDQFFGTSVPAGHGHVYEHAMVDAWSLVAPPENWTPQKQDALEAIIATY